jgi:integrase
VAAESGKLTALAIKHAGPGKHFDGGGLFLHVMSTGAKYWRLKYRHSGKEKVLALGVFPEVSLLEARDRRAKARALLRDGTDPLHAKSAKAEASRRSTEGAFPKVAAAWLARKRKGWAAETYRKASYVTDTYLVPALRRHSIATLTTKQASDVLGKIAERTPFLAAKARQYLGGIVNFAIQEGLREDGRLLSLRGAVPKFVKGNIPAAVDLALVREVVQAVENYPEPVTRAALKLAMLTAQRPGVIAAMEWSEVDLDAGEWSIPAAKMKTRHAHLVPLPAQAIQLLRERQRCSFGSYYVFPPLARQKTPHLHRDSMSNALRRAGLAGRHATHGFRGMFRTVARERLGLDPDVLEAQLAHAKRGDVQKAYDRTTFDDWRSKAMQAWANFLDALSSSASVVPIKRKAS